MSKAGCVLLVLATIVVAGFWTMVMYADIKQDSGSLYITANENPTINAIEIQNNMGIYGVDVRFLDSSSEYLVKADWSYAYTYYQNYNAPPKIVFTNITEGTTLKISMTVENSDGNHMNFGFFNSNVTIQINKAYPINFTADMGTGSLDVRGENIIFSEFDVKDATGSIDIDLKDVSFGTDVNVECSTGSTTLNLENAKINDNLKISGSTGSVNVNLKAVNLTDTIIAESETGSVNFEVQDLKFSTAALVQLHTSLGSIHAYWVQTKAIGQNVNMSLVSETGSVNLEFQIPMSIVRYDIMASADTGSVNLEEGSNSKNVPYQSNNYGNTALDLMKVSAKADTGSVNISVPSP